MDSESYMGGLLTGIAVGSCFGIALYTGLQEPISPTYVKNIPQGMTIMCNGGGNFYVAYKALVVKSQTDSLNPLKNAIDNTILMSNVLKR